MTLFQTHPSNTVFVILSFEGPDRYAQAGGLGVRVTGLSRALAKRGFQTHLFFVGDPNLPGLEQQLGGRLLLHRWCQWISRHHPLGVYDGEEGKHEDFATSVPPFIVEEIARPAISQGQHLVVLAEAWHAAQTLCRLSDLLHAAGLRQGAILFWNANNTMAFHRVDWGRLDYVATLTTVSRYMRQLMRGVGVDPLVIPNGIPAELLEPVDTEAVSAVRQALAPDGHLLLFKVGRFDPAKGWLMSVEAAARLKALGQTVAFPFRGGIEPHGAEVLTRAYELGLTVRDVAGKPKTWRDALGMIQATGAADLYNLRFFMTQAMLRPFYAAADAVLANSNHEPFGLVGLETMAAGGIAFTGSTGEDYSVVGQGALTLDTDNPDGIVLSILDLHDHPERSLAMRQAARQVAARFMWDSVLEMLLGKVTLAACEQGVIRLKRPSAPPIKRVRDVVIYTVVHQPRRLRLPAQPIPAGTPREEVAAYLFDDELNERYFHQVAERCYYPATERFLGLVEQGLKLTIGFSFSLLEQAQHWDPALLFLFRQLVTHPNVALAVVEPYHSFLMLWDLPRFGERMRQARERLQALFGVAPIVADTTELMMSDGIYHVLDGLGFQGAFFDGRPWALEWRDPTYVYHRSSGALRLLARHHTLSDDVGYRFSNRAWDGWPLLASTYADWLADAQGDLVVLGWDYETFGEHHSAETGIFDFLDRLVPEAQARGLTFRTAGEAIGRHAEQSHDLPLSAFPTTWAGSGGLEFFLGNSVQQAVFQLMLFAYNKALLTEDPTLMDLALWLAQSDNLHMIQWHGRQGSEAEVSAYFTPQEWWALGPERIVFEIQQVYKNFIAALDEYLTRAHASRAQEEAA
jgi:alpha-amylase